MRFETVRGMALLIMLMAAAGCMSPDPVPDPADAEENEATAPAALEAPAANATLDGGGDVATDALPWHSSGTWFIARPNNDCWTHEIPFAANATGMHLAVTLHLGSHYGFTELPPVYEVNAAILDPAGEPLVTATRAITDEPHLTLESTAATEGLHALTLDGCWGGSDGSAYGDYIAFEIKASRDA